MTFHEFGAENKNIVVLIHPSLVMWDYFEYVIPLMQNRYHLIIPALPGYDKDISGDFTGVEEIAAELAHWLVTHGYTSISCIYGCSMGGAVIARFLADNRVKVKAAVIDGGITPYQLPWVVTRFIAVRDFLMIYAGKLGGTKKPRIPVISPSETMTVPPGTPGAPMAKIPRRTTNRIMLPSDGSCPYRTLEMVKFSVPLVT